MPHFLPPVVEELIQEKNMISSPWRGIERGSIGFDTEQAYLELMMTTTVLGDEGGRGRRSNSVIVYGIPGCGKTTLIESALAKLDKNPAFINARVVVRLSGLTCRNFRSAIGEICSQLNVENPFKDDDDDDEAAKREGEEGEAQESYGEYREGGNSLMRMEATNFEDRLDQIWELLRTKMWKIPRSIIFILDKVDVFAEHPNQHLLYNLLDATANSKSTTPICMIGVTDRVDILELFEKRVKSRFSHRSIVLYPKYDFEEYKNIARRMCSFIPNEEYKEWIVTHYCGSWTTHSNSQQQTPPLQGTRKSKRVTPLLPLPPAPPPPQPVVVLNPERQKWNDDIVELFKLNSLHQILRAVFETDNTMLGLSNYIYGSLLWSSRRTLDIECFEKTYQRQYGRSDLVSNAADLPMTDLIALLSVYKQVQNNKHQPWVQSTLYRTVVKIMHSRGLHREEFKRSIKHLERKGLIVRVSVPQRNAENADGSYEIYYKCELTGMEFAKLWKQYPDLPFSFKEIM